MFSFIALKLKDFYLTVALEVCVPSIAKLPLFLRGHYPIALTYPALTDEQPDKDFLTTIGGKPVVLNPRQHDTAAIDEAGSKLCAEQAS